MTRTQCAALAVMLLTSARSLGADLTVRIDARDVIRRHLQTHETLAVKPGPLVLVYPKWIPAEHAPAGPLDSIIGLEIKANGQRLDWKRDPYEMYAISVTVPAGATQLDITLDTGMPADWRWLFELARQMGEFVRHVDLPGSAPHADIHHLISIAADTAAATEVPADFTQGYGNLVAEAGAVFASRHYRHYTWLLSLSDHIEASTHKPIELLFENDDYYRTLSVAYFDGPRFPHLTRIEGTPDILSEVLKSRTH